MTDDNDPGFIAKPPRYDADGREAIDVLRDELGDEAFIAFCRGNARKYELRAGKKAGTDDAAKASWYRQMAAHVEAELLSSSQDAVPDPREARGGAFEPYQRQALPLPRPTCGSLVLDHGFVRLVESWGQGEARMPEAAIIEAARQSTQGAFRGWKRDERLLRYLYTHKHSTPFEFAGMTIEVRAPIFVFRQWHRHRTQSYNEASARYTELPDLHYVPSVDRLLTRDDANKQAGAAGETVLDEAGAHYWNAFYEENFALQQVHYEEALADGVPKELARLFNPVSRYSQMRATANLRNWLAFLTLRMDPHAQWEIRQYARAVYRLVRQEFPRTAALFHQTLLKESVDES